MAGKLYFAYGSNINLDQMAQRCPEAEVVGPVTLPDHELLFRYSGVATIRPKKDSVVHGLLWNISPRDERSLDYYEGFPTLYDKQQVEVQDMDGNAIPVMAYVMTRERSREPAPPPEFYYEGIKEGFVQNGLPVEALEQSLRQVWREARQMELNRRNDYER